jgi:tetratricopeptide (TPR) repeat protein
MFHRWNWQEAEFSFRRSIELAPNSSKSHHWYGVYLSIRGRLDEAIREMEKAHELDPTALVVMADLAELYYFKRDYSRAESELLRVLEIDPSFLNARQYLVKVRFKNGGSYFLEEAALNAFLMRYRKAEALFSPGETTELEALLARNDEKTLKENSLNAAVAGKDHLLLARYYSILGDKSSALDRLEKSLEGKPFVLPFVAVDPIFDPVRDDPRFDAILRKMNLTG